MRTCPRVTRTCAIDQLVPTANRYPEISSEPENTKLEPKTAPRPLRSRTSAVTIAAAANNIAPPNQMATRARAATAFQARSITVPMTPIQMDSRAHL